MLGPMLSTLCASSPFIFTPVGCHTYCIPVAHMSKTEISGSHLVPEFLCFALSTLVFGHIFMAPVKKYGRCCPPFAFLSSWNIEVLRSSSTLQGPLDVGSKKDCKSQLLTSTPALPAMDGCQGGGAESGLFNRESAVLTTGVPIALLVLPPCPLTRCLQVAHDRTETGPPGRS